MPPPSLSPTRSRQRRTFYRTERSRRARQAYSIRCNIGNRITSQEVNSGETTDVTYATNELNQYTQIDTNGSDFKPEFDADGNQTLIQTDTGIWKVEYNIQNRAISFTRASDGTVITCDYDYAGRRVYKKVEQAGTVTLHERYLYRGYLQIASLNMLDASQAVINTYVWDPSQPVATRPLAIFYKGVAYYYGWDLAKNVTEIFSLSARLQIDYVYMPFEQVRENGIIPQPLQWSSEMHDAETGLVYYNYRYYNPRDGRWTRRDPLFRLNRYSHTGIDYLGLDNTYGLPEEFWDWFHRCEKAKYVKSLPREKKIRSKNCPKDVYDPRNPDVPKEDALKFHDEWKDLGKPRNCRKKGNQKRDLDPRVKQVYRRSEEGSKYSDYST